MQTLKTALSGKKVGESRDMVKLLRIQATETHLVEFDNVDARFNDCTNWQVVKGGERILFSTRMHERFSEVKSGVLATITVCENAATASDSAMLESAPETHYRLTGCRDRNALRPRRTTTEIKG